MEVRMTLETTPWNIAELLDSEEAVTAYLDAVFEDGDLAEIGRALGHVAFAKGMSAMAQEAKLTREALYRALGQMDNPALDTLDTLAKVLKPMGQRLAVVPVGVNQPQKITAPDGTPLVVITEKDYLALIDAADIASADRALAESDFTVPAEVLDAMLAGKSAVAAWREFRGMTQGTLAQAATMLQPSLARIEAGKSKLRGKTANMLAKALDVPEWALRNE
jgi:probable addiction module antidote protein